MRRPNTSRSVVVVDGARFKSVKCLQMLGFLSGKTGVGRQYFMGESVEAVVAARDDDPAIQAMESLIQAMIETDTVIMMMVRV